MHRVDDETDSPLDDEAAREHEQVERRVRAAGEFGGETSFNVLNARTFVARRAVDRPPE
jgi:hypothetical protein